MTITAASVKWAVSFISDHSDGDIFPKISEIRAIADLVDEFADLIDNQTLTENGKPAGGFICGAPRRFIVPKDEISYRQATQLDPQDSILLTALVYQFGQGIEDRRLTTDTVFSYRYLPSPTHGLYSSQIAWNDFWTKVSDLADAAECVLYCDIADFYNQIYHHTIENQLIESGFPNQAVKWIVGLLEATTASVSRGIPIGPHAVHLLAEATLIPVDNSLSSSGFTFTRYADDILIFCNSRDEAKTALARMANILDKQQRLQLQRHKTRFLSREECKTLSASMIEDRPINRNEGDLLEIIKKYSGGNPYRSISYEQVDPSDWAKISDDVISDVIESYIGEDEIDFIRLRWFFRRLAQIGHPGGIETCLKRISELEPCFANVCSYLASVQQIDEARWLNIGERLLELLESNAVRENEFFRLMLLSLFSKNPHINHFDKLATRFGEAEASGRREILLSAFSNGAFDWLREHKESFASMDPWQKNAFLFCSSGFPSDEKSFFLNRCPSYRPFEKILIKWVRQQ